MPAALKRLPPAVADIIRAAEWYDDQQPGLGDEFVAEVDDVIKSLPKNPYAHAIRFEDVRCARLKRFKKYGVFYFVWQDEVIVFSVFHGSRHPPTSPGKETRGWINLPIFQIGGSLCPAFGALSATSPLP